MGAVGTGVTMLFGTSGFACELIDVEPPKATRGKIDMTHQGTTVARAKSPTKLVDWDDARITFAFAAGTDPPIDEDPEEITITAPDNSTWVFQGFMTEYGGTLPLEEKQMGSATIAVDGDVNITAG